MSLLRWCLRIQVLLSKEDALKIARQHCLKQSWPWLEPVQVVLLVRDYEVFTNANIKGGNATIRIDGLRGVVTSAAYAPR